LEIIKDSRGLGDRNVAHGRSGMVGERPLQEIGSHALRGGDVVGDHTVMFAGIGERIELTHRATDRKIFAAGALRAAKWVLSRNPANTDISFSRARILRRRRVARDATRTRSEKTNRHETNEK